jgi:hypothetical protein
MDDITSTIIRMIPSLLVWAIGLVLSIKMLRRSGTKPEKLFTAGCSLILLKTLLSPLPRIIIDVWMNREAMSNLEAARMTSIFSIPGTVISLAGFICLVIAFWIKFKVERQEVM